MRLISDPHHIVDPEACPECGLAYVHDSETDQRLHAEIHHENVNGVYAPPVDSKRRMQRFGEFEIFLASAGVSPLEEVRLEQAASNANSETHYDFGLFHAGDIDDSGTRVLWARAGDRIAGLLLFDPDVSVGFHVLLKVLKDEIDGSEQSTFYSMANDLRGGIAYISVLRKHRSRGLGGALVKAAFRMSDGGWNDIAFQKPLTPDAARLIYRMALRDERREICVY
jgi:predicted acetyltransferase